MRSYQQCIEIWPPSLKGLKHPPLPPLPSRACKTPMWTCRLVLLLAAVAAVVPAAAVVVVVVVVEEEEEEGGWRVVWPWRDDDSLQ